MADVNYFLKPPSWKVLSNAGALLGKILPAKGSTIKIERQRANSPKVHILLVDRAKPPQVLIKDFTFNRGKGRLELVNPDYLLVIEEARHNGRPGLIAKAEAKQERIAGPIRKLPKEDMTGTWGAEANPTGGGRS